jgi:dTDP-glucose 4,6-dehydratase
MYPIESPCDPILQEDIEYLVAHFDFSELYNSAVLVSGATGLIGSQLIQTLSFLNTKKNADITIYALARSNEKIKRIFHNVHSADKINFIIHEITEELFIDCKIDYIIHGASIVQSRAFVDNPVETINTAFWGTLNMLKVAREKKVKGFVYLSSMEVYGVTDPRLSEVKESDYGYIDIINPRSSYSESKRMCECLCISYKSEYNVPAKIARLVQVVGPGTDYNDTRVPAQFARSVIENKDIVLKTEGKTLRPIVYTRDALAGIFTVLLKGQNGEAYTVANSTSAITIRETAEMIIKEIANDKIKLVLDIDVPAEYAPNLNLNLNLNTTKLESLGWKAEVGIEEAYRRMIESIKDMKKLCNI